MAQLAGAQHHQFPPKPTKHPLQLIIGNTCDGKEGEALQMGVLPMKLCLLINSKFLLCPMNLLCPDVGGVIISYGEDDGFLFLILIVRYTDDIIEMGINITRIIQILFPRDLHIGLYPIQRKINEELRPEWEFLVAQRGADKVPAVIVLLQEIRVQCNLRVLGLPKLEILYRNHPSVCNSREQTSKVVFVPL